MLKAFLLHACYFDIFDIAQIALSEKLGSQSIGTMTTCDTELIARIST